MFHPYHVRIKAFAPKIGYPLKHANAHLSSVLGARHAAAVTRTGLLYTWGCGAHGVLGQGTSAHHHTPVVVSQYHLFDPTPERRASGALAQSVPCGNVRVSDVALGAQHTLVVAHTEVHTGEGVAAVCMSCGSNDQAQLGRPCLTPRGDGTHTAPSWETTLMWGATARRSGSARRSVFDDYHGSASFGDSSRVGGGRVQAPVFDASFAAVILGPGSLGRGRDAGVPLLSASPVMCAAGTSHSLCVLDTGVCLAWGSNQHGQLGLGDSILGSTVSRPAVVEALAGTTVQAASAGMNHSMFRTERGAADGASVHELYTCGDGGHGQLGLMHKDLKVGDVHGRGVPSLVVGL